VRDFADEFGVDIKRKADIFEAVEMRLINLVEPAANMLYFVFGVRESRL